MLATATGNLLSLDGYKCRLDLVSFKQLTQTINLEVKGEVSYKDSCLWLGFRRDFSGSFNRWNGVNGSFRRGTLISLWLDENHETWCSQLETMIVLTALRDFLLLLFFFFFSPAGLGSLGLAIWTLISRPSNSFLSRFAIAFSASAAVP